MAAPRVTDRCMVRLAQYLLLVLETGVIDRNELILPSTSDTTEQPGVSDRYLRRQPRDVRGNQLASPVWECMEWQPLDERHLPRGFVPQSKWTGDSHAHPPVNTPEVSVCSTTPTAPPVGFSDAKEGIARVDAGGRSAEPNPPSRGIAIRPGVPAHRTACKRGGPTNPFVRRQSRWPGSETWQLMGEKTLGDRSITAVGGERS